MSDEPLILQITMIEVAQLSALVGQFAELVTAPDDSDSGLARLAPDAYPEDPEAGREFSRLTRADLLDRRADEAGIVLGTLGPDVPALDELTETDAAEVRTIELSHEEAGAWMRTLAAVRLILAERVGIETEDDVAAEDPRYMLYEWVGSILDALVRALDDRL